MAGGRDVGSSDVVGVGDRGRGMRVRGDGGNDKGRGGEVIVVVIV